MRHLTSLYEKDGDCEYPLAAIIYNTETTPTVRDDASMAPLYFSEKGEKIILNARSKSVKAVGLMVP